MLMQEPRYMRRLPHFLVVAYVLSWLVWAPLFLANAGIIREPVYARALFLLGGIGPIGSAILFAWWAGGIAQVRTLLAPLLWWRASPGWYAFAVMAPVAMVGAGYAVAVVTGAPAKLSADDMITALIGIAWRTIFIPVEEVGWRGYALPALQARYGFVTSALILGIVWSAWHLPLFGFSAGYHHSGASLLAFLGDFLMFALNVAVASIILSYLWNNTGGNLLLCCLLHAVNNSVAGLFGPYQNDIASLVVSAGLVIIVIVSQKRNQQGEA